MARRTIRTDKKAEVFLNALREGLSVTAACTKARAGRRSFYDWRDEDDAFRAQWDEAVESGTERLEDEALRRALDGTRRPVYQQGKLVGHVKEYSDTLMIFLLKARKPEKYKDRIDSNVRFPDGPIAIAVTHTIVDPVAE